MASTSWRQFKNMFVLTIGIDEYQHCSRLYGAVADADAMELFFRDDLGVPPNRIMNLRNESATRENIIKTIHALREDDSLNIGKDDPIVIYFAGHGCLAASKEGDLKASIQAICPQDVEVEDKPNRTVFPIPDYLLGSLINQLSEKKGNNNITVIFDCCHAASGTRELGVRCVTFHGDIPSNIGLRSQHIPLGFLDQHSRSHVFLAACGANENAHEANGHGRFTNALLETFRKPGVSESSYIEFMKHMPYMTIQTPQCEGHFKDRILFSTQIPEMGTPFFQIFKCPNERYEIKAGSIHSVTKGSLFEVFAEPVSNPQFNKHIGTLRVENVYPFSSDAVLEPNGEVIVNPAFALQVRRGPEFKLKVHFSSALLDNVRLCDVLIDALNYEVDPVAKENAEFIVDLEATKAVFVTTLDIVTRHGYQGKLPYDVEAKAEPISRVLLAACRWKHHLFSEPSRGIWRDQVHIEFFRLETGEGDGLPLERNNSPKMNDDNKVEIIVPPDSDELYGMEIKNCTMGQTKLYLLLVLFQINDLSIEILHEQSIGTHSDGGADPSLLPNSTLPIGWGLGGPGSSPFTYALPNGIDVDVAILKLYLTTKPISESFKWLEQSSAFDFDSPTPRHQVPGAELRRRMKSPDHQWDTILFPVVQRSPNASS